MMDSKEINCPLCNSIDHERIYKKEYKIWNKGKCFKWIAQQVICRECGMIFTNPQPTNKALKWFYESDTRFGKHLRYFKDTQLDFIQKNTPKNCKTIFDIGAFEGIFLEIAKSRGYTVFGIEPSAEGVDRAMKEYKIKIVKGFFNKEFLNNFNSKFDIITIRHVLEHVQNPVDFLKLAIKITNPCRYIYRSSRCKQPFPL